MQYQRSHDIEKRLDAVLRLIGTGSYSTPTLAEELKVSIPTISRVTALRERGYDIRAEKGSVGWRYTIKIDPRPRSSHRSRRVETSASSTTVYSG